jgi:hypothetical protein
VGAGPALARIEIARARKGDDGPGLSEENASFHERMLLIWGDERAPLCERRLFYEMNGFFRVMGPFVCEGKAFFCATTALTS